MKPRISFIATAILAGYLLIIIFTEFSLTGFWTDIVLSILLAIVSVFCAFKIIAATWKLILLRSLSIATSCILLFIGMKAINPFVFDLFKMRTFYFEQVDGRYFNAYFKPVGAYSGGYGNLWITESPTYFPIIERRVFYQHAMHHDYSMDTFEDELIDNTAIIRNLIQKEIIMQMP